jgi:hypothetical protein
LLRSIATANGHNAKLVSTSANAVGLSLADGRLIWAENHARTGRLRALSVG